MRKISKTLVATMIIVATVTAFLIGCKKEKETKMPDNEQVAQNDPKGQEAIARIVDFRDKLEAYKKNPAMRAGETVSLAEAVWNIENLFNITYAMPEEFYSETANFEFSLWLPVDSDGRVTLPNLFNVYDQAVVEAQTAYANDGFINKGFVFMIVDVEEQNNTSVRLVFKGKTGERTSHPNWHPHDSAMYGGPFDTNDNWQYVQGMGKCDSTCLESGADKEIQSQLEVFLRSTLTIPESGTRAVYVNSVLITFDGNDYPNDVFYRENVNATCIDFNNMNRLFQREKRLIFETFPNNESGNVYGYKPIMIEIEGLKDENAPYITHQNNIRYAQRLIADITVVGETQDLLYD
jgi:hypothetical protein